MQLRCLFETLVLDSHACPRRPGFETRKVLIQSIRCPSNCQKLLEGGGLNHPYATPRAPSTPLAPLPTPPPPKKNVRHKPRYAFSNVFRASGKTFGIIPKNLGQPQNCGKRLSLKFHIFSGGPSRWGPRFPVRGGKGMWVRGTCDVKTARKESAQQTHTNLQVPCRETLLKATTQEKGYNISSLDISQTRDGFSPLKDEKMHNFRDRGWWLALSPVPPFRGSRSYMYRSLRHDNKISRQ